MVFLGFGPHQHQEQQDTWESQCASLAGLKSIGQGTLRGWIFRSPISLTGVTRHVATRRDTATDPFLGKGSGLQSSDLKQCVNPCLVGSSPCGLESGDIQPLGRAGAKDARRLCPVIFHLQTYSQHRSTSVNSQGFRPDLCLLQAEVGCRNHLTAEVRTCRATLLGSLVLEWQMHPGVHCEGTWP